MLKKTDKRLLALLRANARSSTSELARRLDISRSTVQSRLESLERDGIIKGYTVVFGDDYEQRLITSYVQIKVAQKLTAKTNTQLKAFSGVSALHAISGDYDLIAVLRTETTQELSRVLDEIGNLTGVERTNSSVILETKFSR